MGLIELISIIGESNVKVQSIEASTVKIDDKKRTGDTEITFSTNEINANDYIGKTGKVGLVIWMDGEKARELLS